MTTSTITFDQMERRADRTLAVVLWAKHAKSVAFTALWFSVLNRLVQSLVKSHSSERLNLLSDHQVKELTVRLQEIRENLVNILDHGNLCLMRRNPLLRRRIEELEESIEDLSDVIENLLLSSNSDFRAIVADCVHTIASTRSAETIGHM